MSGQDPIQQKLLQLQTQGVSVSSEEASGLIETYNKKFGLDQPLWRQYFNYLGDMARLDLGVSISNYPATVLHIAKSNSMDGCRVVDGYPDQLLHWDNCGRNAGVGQSTVVSAHNLSRLLSPSLPSPLT